MRTMWLSPLAAVAAFAAGCGDGAGEGASESGSAATTQSQSQPAKPAAPRASGAVVRTAKSQFGPILADRRGQALYFFAKEKTERSECYGECAKAWPPLLTKGKPRAKSGARGALVGTTRRRDGKLQVTYRGRPVYYYVHDAPGRVLCHNVAEFGGLWLVLRGNGRAVS